MGLCLQFVSIFLMRLCFRLLDWHYVFVYIFTYDDVCELVLCLPSRSTCANILVANYFYKLPFHHAHTTVSALVTYVETSSEWNKHTCFNFQLFFLPFYLRMWCYFVASVYFSPFTDFCLITCSTLNTTTSLPYDSYSNSLWTVSQLSTRKSIQFTLFLF